MTLSNADKVWNRAAMENGGSAPREGDRAIASLLLVHGMVMNGGVAHVFEALTPDEVGHGIAGFRYFGFAEVATLLEGAVGSSDEERELLDDQYNLLVPGDGVLGVAFESRLQSRPAEFAPLEDE